MGSRKGSGFLGFGKLKVGLLGLLRRRLRLRLLRLLRQVRCRCGLAVRGDKNDDGRIEPMGKKKHRKGYPPGN